jgi:hypothetical protein
MIEWDGTGLFGECCTYPPHLTALSGLKSLSGLLLHPLHVAIPYFSFLFESFSERESNLRTQDNHSFQVIVEILIMIE